MGNDLKGRETLAGADVIAVAYALGTIFDRLTAILIRLAEVSAWEHLTQTRDNWLYLSGPVKLPSIDEIRLDIRLSKNDHIADELDDVRRPLRVVRATALNLIGLMIVLVASLLFGKAHITSASVSFRITAFCAIALVLAISATLALELQYYRRSVLVYWNACPDLYPKGVPHPR